MKKKKKRTKKSIKAEDIDVFKFTPLQFLIPEWVKFVTEAWAYIGFVDKNLDEEDAFSKEDIDLLDVSTEIIAQKIPEFKNTDMYESAKIQRKEANLEPRGNIDVYHFDGCLFAVEEKASLGQEDVFSFHFLRRGKKPSREETKDFITRFLEFYSISNAIVEWEGSSAETT